MRGERVFLSVFAYICALNDPCGRDKRLFEAPRTDGWMVGGGLCDRYRGLKLQCGRRHVARKPLSSPLTRPLPAWRHKAMIQSWSRPMGAKIPAAPVIIFCVYLWKQLTKAARQRRKTPAEKIKIEKKGGQKYKKLWEASEEAKIRWNSEVVSAHRAG